MAKNFKNNKNNNNNNNNYFAKNIREKGKDFLCCKNARELANDSRKVFREIAKGQIDLAQYGEYFLDQQFLECCIQTAYNEFAKSSISMQGVELLITQAFNNGQPVDQMTIAVKEDHKRRAEAYCIIYQVLTSIRMTGDVNNLFVLPSKLRDYRYNL